MAHVVLLQSLRRRTNLHQPGDLVLAESQAILRYLAGREGRDPGAAGRRRLLIASAGAALVCGWFSVRQILWCTSG